MKSMMLEDLRGRTLIVTGAASGIGAACLRAAVLQGMRVLAVDRDAHGIEAQCAEVGEAGTLVTPLVVDLLDAGATDLVIGAAEALDGADHLIHAAGLIVRRASISEVTLADYDLQTSVNQRASWFMIRGFCESLLLRNRQGSAIALTSISGNLGVIGGSWVYASTKAAVQSMIKGFAKTYGPAGIRVNGLSPGIIETPMVRRDMDADRLEQLIQLNVPLGRIGDPHEVASVAIFLLSGSASYVNGVNVEVDGGWLCR